MLRSIVHSGTSGTIRKNIENMGGTEVERAENGSERGKASERSEILLGVRIKNCLRNQSCDCDYFSCSEDIETEVNIRNKTMDVSRFLILTRIHPTQD